MESELEIVRAHMGKEPVNVAAILSDLGVAFEERPILSGESGWIECQGGNFTVVVNEAESEQRRRFTAAHELAHYLMHRDLLCEDGDRLHRHTDRLFGANAELNRKAPLAQRHEAQANKLAAQIIMPASRIKEVWDSLDQENQTDKIGVVAGQFGVSKAAMEIRAKTLGLIDA